MIDVAEVPLAVADRFPTRQQLPPERLDSLSRDILALKKKLNAVILAHNYQVPEIQDVSDYVGDSPVFRNKRQKRALTSLFFAAFISWRRRRRFSIQTRL